MSVSNRTFEPLSSQNRSSWKERWQENQGNFLLGFTGLVGIVGVLVMFFVGEKERWPDIGVGSDNSLSDNYVPFEPLRTLPLGARSDGGTDLMVGSGPPIVRPPDFIAAPPTTDPISIPADQANVMGSGNLFMIAVNGAVSDRGQIRIAIYDQADGFNDVERAIFRQAVRVEDGSGYLAMVVDSLPATFAIAAYHDENDNGELDRNYLKIPTEAYGFTNRARGILGPPLYESAVIECPLPGVELRVEIRK